MERDRRVGISIQPQIARWFELYVPREETVYAIEALAKSGQVQLELDKRLVDPLNINHIREVLDELDSFCNQHRIALPSYEMSSSQLEVSSEETARRALEYVHHWSRRYFQLEDELKQQQAKRENLTLLSQILVELDDDNGIEGFGHRGEFLCKGIYACPKDHPRFSELRHSLVQSVFHEGVEFVFFAALPEERHRIDRLFEASTCIEVTIPKWLPKGLGKQREAVASNLSTLSNQIHDSIAKVDMHRRSPRLKEVLANVSVLKWFMENAPNLGSKQRFCHVTGWTTLPEHNGIERVLKEAKIHSVARYPQPPVGILPPVHVLEHWWCRPFEMFNALAQSPGRGEIDPRLVIPLVVPLLFGFMFPDVGHGLVITLLGLGLYIHRPQFRFLIPCGFGAMGFGFLFGEFFGLEGTFPVYWFHPLDDPLRILWISLLFGASLILMGMVFSGIEAYWKSEFRRWLLIDAAVLTLYASLLSAFFVPALLWLLPLVSIWYLIGSCHIHRCHSLGGVLAILGHLLQSSYELAVNSFSFIRIGAFALAHAGLTSAIIELSEGFDSSFGRWTMLVLGHLLVIAIEGLVVFIQTSRLLLFEFFTRFLHAEGRVFRPLNYPVG